MFTPISSGMQFFIVIVILSLVGLIAAIVFLVRTQIEIRKATKENLVALNNISKKLMIAQSKNNSGVTGNNIHSRDGREK